MADIKVTITEQTNPSVTINTIPRTTLSSEISSNDAELSLLNTATGTLDASVSGLETATGVLSGLADSISGNVSTVSGMADSISGNVSTIESTFVSGDSDASLKDLTLDGHFELNIPSANRTPGTSVALIKSNNGTAANLRVEGPIAATHDLFKNSGLPGAFADNSNHFHTVHKIDRITQQVGAGKPNERVQEQYYAIASNNLKNDKAAFWNWHRVSRSVASTSVGLTNLVGWNVSAIQDTNNRLSNSEASFPAGGAEATVLIFDNESNRSAVLSNGDLLQVTISIDFEGAIVAATLYAEVTAVDAAQATVVLYGGNYKSIGQVAKGSNQTALTSGFTINKIDVNQYMGLSDGTVTVLADSTRASETYDTFSLSFSSAHSLELNDVITVITDGDSAHGFKDAEVAFVKEVTSTTEAKFVYGRVFDPAPASPGRSNVTGGSFVGILRGTLDGLHRFTAGDQLMHFNADSEGRYKSYQIGPGSEVGADCIAIGKNVYNKDASTIKIGYDNAMLDVRSDGLEVNGDISATGTATAATPTASTHLTTKDYVDGVIAALGTAATTASSDYATAAQGTTADNALAASAVSTFGGELIDDLSAASARGTLGLGDAATTDSSNYATAAQGVKADSAEAITSNITAFGGNLIDDVDAATARTTLVLGNVDNTADAAKPVSTAQQTALDSKANKASPNLTGDVKLGDFNSTSRSAGASALDPVQNNQPASDDTVANLCVDSAGNVVRGSQEATWTFNSTQLNALTSTRINLLDSPGAGKCVVIEETNWLIEVDLLKAYQATNVNLKCEMLGVNENSVATQITAANMNQIAQILKTANTNSFGLYHRDVPDLARIYRFGVPMTIRATNGAGATNVFPDNFKSVKLKIKYRVFDSTTF